MNHRAQQDLDLDGLDAFSPDIRIIDSFLQDSNRYFSYFRDHIAWDEGIKSRKTASFGLSYNYPGVHTPDCIMHPKLAPICQRIEQAFGFSPNNCSLNYYVDGDSSIGYHSDSAEELKPGTGVVIVSLGGDRVISFKLKQKKSIVVKYVLKSNSALFMDISVQDSWWHAIPKRKKSDPRISLSFRDILR